ncbi:glutamine--fructose-6-phosphate transaminase (isomerizing) [Estrella lausannensis]|uniref:Glutamine--fructose-6-phosphate aminotransferase [isomerizing] n=1 Tax=Estrella lausannensis TaxID=483423 RepID=A0A0H5E752_9BACT|nr:glutamine--fructose-6-phosphate transaminase (isomerizing) [Estrella lausannensis]CRX39145.1 Glucosamine--fructose-6-phosphate aminotransferase [isomerizing] [Estrella lausannensis]
MCGIFGYIGKKDPVKTAIDGLKRLEYRGYDSAGIAGVKDGKILFCKEVGKVAQLEKEVEKQQFSLDIAIAHTRWATHGEPTVPNAHPHVDMMGSLAVVHNGIIENYSEIKEALSAEGVRFSSETDTEVVAHLIAKNYKGDIIAAVQESVKRLKGAYALAIVHRDFPDRIIAVAHESPMVIGVGGQEAFVSSDPNAFAAFTKKVVFLSKSEIAVVEREKLAVYNVELQKISKEETELEISATDISKGHFEHYTLKEIFEQPVTVANAMSGRFSTDLGTALLNGIEDHLPNLGSTSRILILACGTSWHAGYVASYFFEEMAQIPVEVEISSEFRYKNPIVAPNTLVVAISQSGETADTIAAVRELKAKGARLLSICNVQGSTLARESDHTLFLNAGPEVGVCSTKAFTSQIVVLFLLSLFLARRRHMSRDEGKRVLAALTSLPDAIKSILNKSGEIERLAKKYAKFENFFFLGRQYMYPTALEGALKLKEISYINANGYPAGEMKHGPIALISPDCPTVALLGNKKTFDKMLSNLMEVRARKGEVIAITEEGFVKEISKITQDFIEVPQTIDELSPVLSTVVTQLFAYFVAKERGCDIDKPRNLAKSVTVE